MRQRPNRASGAGAVIVALCSASVATAAPLGRLFFTTEQRTTLDYRWQLGTSQAQAGASRNALAGLVWRSADRSTLWINGTAVYQKSAAMQIERDQRDPARVDLRLAGRPPLRLRVGEQSK